MDWTAPLGRTACLLAVSACLAPPASALDPGRAITQYVLDSWTVKDGAPAGTITGITQTPDGYLWLATQGEGLVRFDGISFVRTDGLDVLFGRRVDRISSLLCGRDGTLWAGTKFGLARWKDSRWTALDRGELQIVFGLHETPAGEVWYARPWEGIHRVTGDVVSALPLAGKPRFLASDGQRVLWAGGYEGLWRIGGSDRRMYTARDGLRDANVTHLYGDSEGRVWVGHIVGLSVLRDGKIEAHYTTQDGLSSNEISVTLMDRDGVLWVGTANGGLNRKRGVRFDALPRTSGLTNNHVTALYEDRERGLWVGTAGGLNRLRDGRVLPIGEPEGLAPGEAIAVAEARDGGVLVSSGFGGIQSIREGVLSHLPASESKRDGPLFVDADGSIWSGDPTGLTRRHLGHRTHVVTERQVQCISRDALSLLFADTAGEVFRIVEGHPQRYLLADGSPVGRGTFGVDFVWMMHLARDGTLWLATSRGALAIRDGVARQVWHQGTLSARSVFEDEQGTLWFGTDAGVLRIAGDAVFLFTTRHGLRQDNVYHVLTDRVGGIWMTGASGIDRGRRSALEDVTQGKARAFATTRFGVLEGLRTAEAASASAPTACATRDGRLWFAMSEGLVMIDPAHLAHNALPPPVVVESLEADGRQVAIGPSAQLAAGTQQLSIHYTGLSLLVPQQVRFKYKLEGYDRDWIAAVSRRVAVYTKLPPGQFRFRVVAANNDGVWNETGASIELRQLPYVHQTTWFRLAITLLAGASLWGFVALRARRHARVERQLQQRILEALNQVKTLTGLLPICAWCKKIRDDTGNWTQMETYVRDHTQAKFSHGICPDCGERLKSGSPPPEPARHA